MNPPPPSPWPTQDSGDSSILNTLSAAVITIFLVLFLIIPLQIARFLIRRAFLLGSQVITGDTHSGEPPRTGLDPSIIASLPSFICKNTSATAAVEGGDESGLECVVCLSCLKEEDMATIFPNCKHVFHAKCVDEWLSLQSNCPVCRTEVDPRFLQVSREGPVASAPVDFIRPPWTESGPVSKW